MEKVVLIDGNNLMFRSYYATMYSGAAMVTSTGIKTNAIYSFINMINKIVNEERPDKLLIAFDKGKTFRHEEFDFYKDGRKETPDDLKTQFKLIKELLPAMGICHYEIDSYEADDIIGTFSKKFNNNDYECLIVSSDKDLLQLITKNVSVKLLKQTGHILYNEKQFISDYGFEPIKMIDLKAISGDPSDNIKGVKGIGEKGAIKLIMSYNSLEGIYENLDKVSASIKNKLELDRENAFDSKRIVTIYNEVPCAITIDDLNITEGNPELLDKLYRKYEFTSFLKDSKNSTMQKIDITIADENIKLDEKSAFYIETFEQNYHIATPFAVVISNKNNNYYISFKDFVKAFDNIKDMLNVTYDVKRAIVILNRFNLKLELIDDISLMIYLLGYNIKSDISSVSSYFGYDIESENQLLKKYKNVSEIEVDEISNNSIKKSMFIYNTFNDLLTRINKESLESLYKDIELPLADVLSDMEIAGIKIDVPQLNILQEEIKTKLDTLNQEIWDMVGFEFNIASPKQLGEVLFETLEIPNPKKKKTGYSTDKDTLLAIEDLHPVVKKVLEHRLYSKLHTSYASSFGTYILDDGKIHTIYNQVQTRTGRLSSTDPNLQTIPIRSKQGKEFRKIFIASNENSLIASDYSQIELRIFAHVANEEALIEAFRNNEDIHTSTAAKIYDVDIKDVTSEMRGCAKAVNFGILYGISDFGLARDLRIPTYKAKEFINKYFETFPGIKTYMEEVISEAYKTSTVETLYGRKRKIEELESSNYMIRSMGERMVLNTPIQGTSADIIKCAMININKEFKNKNIKSKMILQIHDELVFDCPMDEIDIVSNIVKECMTNVINLNVPLLVETGVGQNLLETK